MGKDIQHHSCPNCKQWPSVELRVYGESSLSHYPVGGHDRALTVCLNCGCVYLNQYELKKLKEVLNIDKSV